MPRCISKLQGARIQTGLLNQEEVIKSLRSYHKLAGQWVEAILKHKAVIQDHDIKKLERKTWPNYIIDKFTYLDTGMVASSFEDDNSVPMRSIKNCMKLIKSVSKKHNSGPSAYQTPGRTLIGSPVAPPSDAATTTSAITTVVKEKNVRQLLSTKYSLAPDSMMKTKRSMILF